jgi:outer membrane immunogenic protein
MRQIISTLFGVSILGLACAPATLAADMPLKATTPAPNIGPNWGGFYVGGNVGARWSTAKWTSLDFDFVPPAAADNPSNLDKTGFRFGGYVGYNWMFTTTWLVGLEADFGWAGGTATHIPFPGDPLGPSEFRDTVNVKLGWDASARGRLGYLLTPNWLVFGTGGVAWQQITTSASCGGLGGTVCGISINESATETKTGWTVGGGVETMLWGNWIGRAEYRYANFGHVSNRLPPAPAFGFHADIAVQTSIALLGLAYKF